MCSIHLEQQAKKYRSASRKDGPRGPPLALYMDRPRKGKGNIMSKQPRDDGNAAIPVLGFKNNGGQQVPFTSSSSNVSQQIGSSTRVVTLYSTKDAFIETHGLTTVAATVTSGHFLPATVPYDISMGFETAAVNNDKFVSVLGSTESGVLYISERI
jgi:hypothetical protein